MNTPVGWQQPLGEDGSSEHEAVEGQVGRVGHDSQLGQRMGEVSSAEMTGALAHQTTALLMRHFRDGHEAALTLVADLSDENFRWRPSAGPQSIGWNLWHIAKWDDFMAESLVARTPALAHLLPALQIWDSRKVGDQWGWPAGRLGIEDGGTGLEDADAAALTLPAKPDVVEYATAAFKHLEEVLGELDDSLLPQVLPGALLFPTHVEQGTYGDNLLIWMNHGYEHVGTMEALKGLLGQRGGVTG